MNFVRRHPALSLAAALLLLVAAFAGMNAIDQDLSSEAAAFYARPSVAFVPDSGWAVLSGFHAPPSEKPQAYAAVLRQAARNRKPGMRVRSPAPPLEVRAPDELLCVPQEMDCVRAFAQRPQSIDDLVADNAVLLARYEELLGSRRLADVVEALDYFEAIIPHFSTVLRVQQVRMSKAGADASRGRASEAIAWIGKDAAFHRRWLEEAGSILTKMIAIRTLSRDFLLAGQVARAGVPSSPADWDTLERVAAPLAPGERAMGPVLRIEAGLFANVLDELIADSRTTIRVIEAPRLSTTIAGATLRRNATLNFAYPVLSSWTTLDAVPTGGLARAIADVEARQRRHLEPDWTWAYNPTGKAFTAASVPNLAEYHYRMRDLDALSAVIRCVVALHRSETPRGNAAAFVAASPACIDPYEGKPLGWDAERAEISYKARSPKQVDRFGGRGERVAFAAYAP